MTFAALDQSIALGAPCELYQFTRGALVWRYTSFDADVPVGPVTFVAGWPLSRDEPEMSEESKRSSLRIETSADFPIALLFREGAPAEPIWVSVFRKHVGDDETYLLWQGVLRNCNWTPASNKVEFDADPIEKVCGKGGFRQTYGPHCHKKLFSSRCGVAEADHTVPATLASLSADGFTATIPQASAKPNQYFRFGELLVLASQTRIMVLDHQGQTLRLKYPLRNVQPGAQLRLTAGCDHCWKLADGSWGSCKATYNNLVNFGGYPFVPIKNPFESGIG